MKNLTKKEKLNQQAEAITYLKEIFETNKRAFTRCEYVGESRRVLVFIPMVNHENKLTIRNITYLVARALDSRVSKNGGIVIGGCGFSAETDVIEGINYKLYGVKNLTSDEAKTLYINYYSI